MKRIECEVWSRPCGFFSPVDKWNAGKRAEFAERKVYDVTTSLISAALRFDDVVEIGDDGSCT